MQVPTRCPTVWPVWNWKPATKRPQFVSVQGSLSMFSIYRYGSEEQKQQWLPRWLPGRRSAVRADRGDFGSNPAGMRTRARRDGSDWVLNGTKMWITNGSLADVATVWAQTDDGIRGFVVPTDTPGSRPTSFTRSCRCGPRSPRVGTGQRSAARLGAVARPRTGGAAVVPERGPLRHRLRRDGRRRDALETTIAYTQDREVFDRPLSSFQLSQEKLANMTLELGKGVLLAIHLGRIKDAQGVTPEQVSLGKLNNVRSPGHRPGMPDLARRFRHHPGVLTAAPRQQPRIGPDPMRAPPKCTCSPSVAPSPATPPSR